MGIINLVRALLPILKNSKMVQGSAGMILLVVVVGQYVLNDVTAKHREGVAQIAAVQSELSDLKNRERDTAVSMKAIEVNVDTVVEQLRKMDQRIWELYRDSKQSKISEHQEDETHSTGG
jgi:hypothetical protein